MPTGLQEMLPFILLGIAIVIALLIIFRAARSKTDVLDKTTGDVLDEGASPAARNQALIDAPNAAASPPPVPEAAPEPVAAAASGQNSESDDLTQIKGLGPKIATLLAEQGITRFEQIAAWSDSDIQRVDASLGRFQGRIERDQWVAQAKLLAAGNNTGFSETFGQNG